jgi:hypothetical protein
VGVCRTPLLTKNRLPSQHVASFHTASTPTRNPSHESSPCSNGVKPTKCLAQRVLFSSQCYATENDETPYVSHPRYLFR